MKSAEEIYINNIKINKKRRDSLKIRINLISSLRLAAVVLCIITDYILYRDNKINLALAVTISFIALFLILVYFHDILFDQKIRIDLLIKINEEGLSRVNGELSNIEDGGNEYSDVNHPFIDDLDVFGDNSLFKIINSCSTEGGRKELSDILKRKIIFDENEILERQKAINELSHKIDWRQKLIVEGNLNKKSYVNIDDFIEWCSRGSSYNNICSITAFIFIIITLCSIIAALKGIIPESFILLDLMINYAVVKIMSKNLMEDMRLFESIKSSMSAYSRILCLIQDEKFESSYLKELQKELVLDEIKDSNENGNVDCKTSMKKLESIFSWIGDSKYNAYYFLINITLFSDIFLIRSMEKWRNENGIYLKQWIDVMNKIDEMCSFANLDFEHRDWCYPEIRREESVDGISIGHPLLSSRCIKNSFSLKGNNKIALITGSNMSGKSTFLRTVGVNMILAYSGAPVCAGKFSCGIMNLYTCMRTKDNLEESISSFYAEILRIKQLIEAAKRGERIFFLLDEIFKGTNSEDRHTGASILIKQLIGYGGMGLVSTHDFELCDLENSSGQIVNYNFREFYEDNKIKFDYILRRGRSRTRNAVHLMKLAGIDIN